ncbi:hypothetical protein Q4575_05500 [Psychrosphaera sp. 1_MG-2023]|uniref:hypothetical protein n=1 Tax=Psychrosphaera sp. 1_MG-2023 TaxID=3062643 RepID=UPI0026E1E78E|nr:hypothetical protein [Psychrosphaera sp. 1_MG-2023]MDO6718846.1 hypothetical protein [Psychrosphaera sp. 1_MG-2023]
MSIIIGNTYHKFTVIKKLAKKDAFGDNYYLAECECGNEREIRKYNIGRVQSCGCIAANWRKEVNDRSFSLRSEVEASKPKRKRKGAYTPSKSLQVETTLETLRFQKEYSYE